MKCVVALKGFRCDVSIGWTSPERETLQPVEFDIEIKLSEHPNACENDLLEDTICYKTISDVVANVCKESSFKLLEKLAFVVVNEIRKQLSPNAKIKLKLTKLNPPISGLHGGASVLLSDIE